MPKGYVIFTASVKDQTRLDGYGAKAGPTVAQYGGSSLVRRDSAELLEGRWSDATVILEFPSVEQARAWYESPEYQAVIGERHASTDSNVIIISGN